MEKLQRVKKAPYLKMIRATYDAINAEIFNSELPKIPIKIQKFDDDMILATFSVATYKHHYHYNTSWLVDYLSISFNENLMFFADIGELLIYNDILVHEMIHEWNYLQGIRDFVEYTEGQYHNYNFLSAAEQHGLQCRSYDEKHGFWYVTFTEEQYNRIIKRVDRAVWDDVQANIVKIA